MKRIGEVAEQFGVSVDTLRYYEKIGLLAGIYRESGKRLYSDQDMARLGFIKRAQRIGFRLDEIAELLSCWENPQKAKPRVQRQLLRLPHSRLFCFRQY